MQHQSFLLPETGRVQLLPVNHSSHAAHYQESILKALECTSTQFVKIFSFVINPVLDRTPDDDGKLSFHSREMHPVDSSLPNETVATVAGHIKALRFFQGPIVISAFVGHEKIRDVVPTDFAHFVDYAKIQGLIVIPPEMPFCKLRMPAVRVNCDGDMKDFNRPRFENVMIRPCKGDKLEIAEKLGFELFRVIDLESSMREGCVVRNRMAELLDIQINPKGFGRLQKALRETFGSTIVFRKKQKATCTTLVEDLARFTWLLEPQFNEYTATEDERGKFCETKYEKEDRLIVREQIAKEISREKFEMFCRHGTAFRWSGVDDREIAKSHYESFEANAVDRR